MMPNLTAPIPTHTSHKRKRSQPQPHHSLSSSLTVNPLSHSPSLLSQFSIAGLSETDQEPSSIYPDFPHRGLTRSPPAAPNADTTDIDTDFDGDEDGNPFITDGSDSATLGKETKQKKKEPGDEAGISGTVKTLAGSIHHFLSQGEIDKASRAFGLITQLRPKGKPVDVRRHHLWALGAEILMRQGEKPPPGPPSQPPSPSRQEALLLGNKDEGSGNTKERWGAAVNMPRVRAYYESLMHRYPYDYRRPNSTSALDFWPALVSCEMYDIDVERVIALRRLERRFHGDGTSQEDVSSDGGSDDDHDDDDDARLRRKQEAVRTRALRAMGDLARRMDEVMGDAPYSTNVQMLRLRAAAGMFISDLISPLGPDDDQPARMVAERTEAEREQEMVKVRRCLVTAVESGATLSEAELALIEDPAMSEEEEAQRVEVRKRKGKKEKKKADRR